MIDQNATIHSAHEVRVRMRGNRLSIDGPAVQVTMPFIAPDRAPQSTHETELAKGSRDWTSQDKVDLIGYRPKTGLGELSSVRPVGLADRQLAEVKVGTTIIRKPKSTARPIKSRYL